MSVTHDSGCRASDTAAVATPRRMVYSAEEVGELLGGMSRRTVYRRMTDGDIPSFMLGGMRVVTHDDLVAYVERCRTESKDGAA